MQSETTLHLLFNHTLSSEQREDAYQTLGVSSIRYCPDDILEVWGGIPPDIVSLKSWLEPVSGYIASHCRRGDYVLVQGDCGAVYLAIAWIRAAGAIPVYATTQRNSVEREVDGTVIKESIFKHVIFREYGN